MAIRLIDQYPNRAGVPNADYPHGVPRNKSTPTATDGTPFEQAWFRDQEGFFQGLLETAGITPSGSPDTVEQSDYFDALVSAMHGVTEVDVGGVGDVTLGIYPSRVAALRLTGVLGDDVDLIVPDTERLYTIIDETTGGFSVTVRTELGSGVVISGETSTVRCDGSDVVDTLSVATAAEAQGLSSLTKLLTPGRLADAFKGGNQSLTPNGYQMLPGGLIMQWGVGNHTGGETVPVDFPIAFPNEVLGVTPADFGGAPNFNSADSVTTSGFLARVWKSDGTIPAPGQSFPFQWTALGR